MKKHLIHGGVAGILASVAGIIFFNIYSEFYFLDFTAVIDEVAIVFSSIIGSVLMGVGYIILDKVKKPNLYGVLNILIMVLSFLSIVPVMAMSLPLEVEFPEMFPGLVIPMHFFPAMAFFGLAPFFQKAKEAYD
ncbi:hypothetical protein [Brumimicrobium aurantiacum]|uniref:Uncharacterized protein n=1 Tax=Brumimicrobium aurantiacum TaxID=1737063 RepID=A0A3E1EX27_9FLAO|nr:hypothetical protein [Brumimicrobium aurantiacum]RFC54111.1 hypothetical protein DXU93_08975 [Brumimicrobium aurantiacum]